MPAICQSGHSRVYRRVMALFAFLSFSIPVSQAVAEISFWQGPYVGAYLGGGYGNEHASTAAGSVTGTSYFSTSADLNAINSAGTWTQNPYAVIVGLQAGHDWRWKTLIYGVAFDYGALPLSTSKNSITTLYPDNSNTYSMHTSISTHWLFSLRGRLGYQTMLHWPGVLYITGGPAVTKLKVSNSFSDNSSLLGAGGSSSDQNQIGWTAGAGIELATFRHASLDIQYLYVHMPSLRTTGSISNAQGGFGIPVQSLNNAFTTTARLHANLLKIGLNYRFDER